MNTYKRRGNKWTINELLSLQREYELLEWTVQEIAEKHQRSVVSILYKLEAEELISNWDVARGFNINKYKESVENTHDCSTDGSEYLDESNSIADEESVANKLTERVWNLETSVSEISSMVKQMFNSWAVNKSSNSNNISTKC